ncbi:MAG TPA: DUF4389 domain-containing protein, partial [Tepidiformaceae bacterium]|nr:DUF4389 domain-containing protein [Tepidiformaceae bacterium]
MWFDVTYPERLSRLSTLFRGVLLIPLFLFATVLGYLGQGALSAGWIAVVLKKKYPSWLFDSATGYLAWTARVAAYATLLTDRFPSFDAGTSPVALEYERPADGSLSRWKVFLWKALLLIPHLILLSFVWFALFVVVVIAWFAILLTANYPRGLFGFVTGILRWYYRVIGYFASFTDRFPPFALSPEAGAASRSSQVVSAVLGSITGIVFGVSLAAIIAFANRAQIVEADYDDLVAGLPAPRMDYRDYNDLPVVVIT